MRKILEKALEVVGSWFERFWDAFTSVFGHLAPDVLGIIVAAAILAILQVYFRERLRAWSERKGATRTGDVLRRYLERATVRTTSLVFGDPTRTSMDSASVSGIITLDQVWTPLRVTTQSHASKHDAPSARISSTADEELVTEAIHAHRGKDIMILGEPGSGKSTLVDRLTGVVAKEALARFGADEADLARLNVPVRIVLRDVIPSSPPAFADIWSGVPEVSGDPKADELKEELERRIRSGRAVVLMDGLDEVREELLPDVKEIVALMFLAAQNSTVLTTCRTYDYAQQNPNRQLHVPIVLRLLPYTTSQMEEYVTKWYTAVVAAGRLSEEAGNAFRAKLLDSLRRYAELRTLAETPLLLTLLTLVHTEEGELPASRALVYHRAIRYLLAETAQWRRQAAGSTIASAEMMDLAQHVAYVAHSELEKLGANYRGLSLEQLGTIVANYFRLHEKKPGAEFETASAKVNVHLARLIQSNGLLIDQGGGKYDFAHRSFQEFLAGQYFAPGSHHADALRAAHETHWREAFRLLASYGSREGSNLYYLLQLIADLARTSRSSELPNPAPSDPILAGEMLAEIGRDILVANGYENVVTPPCDERRAPNGLWYGISQTLVSLLEAVPPNVVVNSRIRAADVLSVLGDLRFESESGGRISTASRQITLPPITFTVGAAVGSGKEDERPQRNFEFPRFSIGRFLVTNAEYSDFVGGGGYRESKWWETEEARKWLSGEPAFLQAVREVWIATVAEYHAKELRDKEINIDDLVTEAAIRCATRTQPFYWENKRFNRPNQPVVGINWWESRAYCAWLTAGARAEGTIASDQFYRLPTELEWERAARGTNDGRRYPWGNEWDQAKGHTREDGLNLNEPTPVGVYADGTWSGGPLDMSGNVWEWLENRKLPYDAQFDHERMCRDGLDDRAIRGSSWYNTPELARCSARFIDRPYNLYFDVGFRVVLVSGGYELREA